MKMEKGGCTGAAVPGHGAYRITCFLVLDEALMSSLVVLLYFPDNWPAFQIF